jgi:hypothetical protein
MVIGRRQLYTLKMTFYENLTSRQKLSLPDPIMILTKLEIDPHEIEVSRMVKGMKKAAERASRKCGNN